MYYLPESDLRVESYDHLNCSIASICLEIQRWIIALVLLLCSLALYLIKILFVVDNCQGIPEQAEAPPVTREPASAQPANPPAAAPQAAQPASVPSSGPNANPLDLFPQVASETFFYQLKKDKG